jgi:hypothetical protein
MQSKGRISPVGQHIQVDIEHNSKVIENTRFGIEQTVSQLREYLDYIDNKISSNPDLISMKSDIKFIMNDFERILAMVQNSTDAVHGANQKLGDIGKKLLLFDRR